MHVKKFIFTYFFILLVCSCTQRENPEKQTADSMAAANGAMVIRSYFSTPEKEAFQTHCITCHSLRYIQMQPQLPRKTWEKIVDKMIKNFGAPIPDSSAKEIVNYLMEIKGK